MVSLKFSASRKSPGRRAQPSFAPGLRLGRRVGGCNAPGSLTALDKLKANIRRREKLLKAAAKRERNARLSRTRVLPPEILLHIFTFVRYSAEERNGSIDWMTISSVCSLWRQLLFDSPTLWREIDCSRIPWEADRATHKAIFERSQSLPLRITADINELIVYRDLQSFQNCLKRRVCSRIQSLSLQNIDGSYELDEVLYGFRPMPCLTDVSLSIKNWDTGAASSYILPETFERALTAGNELSRISFKGCLPARLSSIMSPALTHLTLIAYSAEVDDTLPGVDDMIQVLLSMQNLRELHLGGMPARPSRGSMAVLARGTCELPPCFRIFNYDTLEHGHGHTCTLDFMSRLKLPAGAELNVNLYQDSGSIEQEITEFAQIIVAARGTFHCNDPSWSVCLASQSVRIDIADPQPDLRSTTSSSITVRRMAGLPGGNVSGILRHLPLDNLIRIEFNRESSEYCLSGNNACINQLLVARQVRDVVVELPVDSDVIYALERTYNNHSHFLFPNLRTVTVLQDGDVDDTAEEDIEQAIAVLGTVCIGRAERGYPMPTLRIDKGYQRLVPSGLETEVKVDFIPTNHRIGDH